MEYKTPIYQRRANKAYYERIKNTEAYRIKRNERQNAYYQANKDKIKEKRDEMRAKRQLIKEEGDDIEEEIQNEIS